MGIKICGLRLVDSRYGKACINQIDTITDGIHDPAIAIIFIQS